MRLVLRLIAPCKERGPPSADASIHCADNYLTCRMKNARIHLENRTHRRFVASRFSCAPGGQSGAKSSTLENRQSDSSHGFTQNGFNDRLASMESLLNISSSCACVIRSPKHKRQ